MASKIQRLVSQARATFRKVGEEPSFSDEMKELKEVVRRTRPESRSLIIPA